ncbi:MAG: GNAT family N-acetyltransferase [Oscillospiraceae bacterium]
MLISTAKVQDLPQLKELWNEIFDDGTVGFCDFAFSLCKLEDIYLVKEEEQVASMLMAIGDVKVKNKNGFYLYSACTARWAREKGYMHRLIEYALQDQKEKGREFCILQPANLKLFDFYQTLGFTTKTYLRKCNIEIKRNLWAKADFDIVTATRFPDLREKMCEDTLVHFDAKGYVKLAEYLYTFGGSTAESKEAYGVYYIEGGALIVKELFATSTPYAIQLLQAIREKTGFEKATVYLSKGSNLFLGEGEIVPHCAIKGLEADLYANLMFD